MGGSFFLCDNQMTRRWRNEPWFWHNKQSSLRAGMCVICVARICACSCHTNVAYPTFRSPPPPLTMGSPHPSPNVKNLCNLETQIWPEIITSRDAKSACFKGSQTSCAEIISGVFLPKFVRERPHHVMDLDGQNRQSPIASVQRTQSTLANHSAVPCGTNVKRMNANRAMRIAAQRTQGLWGLIFVFSREIWPPTNASDSNRSNNSR